MMADIGNFDYDEGFPVGWTIKTERIYPETPGVLVCGLLTYEIVATPGPGSQGGPLRAIFALGLQLTKPYTPLSERIRDRWLETMLAMKEATCQE